MLDKLRHLTCLQLTRIGWFEPCALPSVSFPRLVDFSLKGSINAIGDLLGSIHLPLLQKLSLGTFVVKENSEQGAKVGPALLELQKKSRFPLVSFSLTWMLEEHHNKAIRLDDFVQFLSSVITIEELYIHALPEGDTNTAGLMKSLCYDGHLPILPHLKVFVGTSLRDSRDAGCSHFVDFIQSRWWPTSQSQSSGLDNLECLDIQDCNLNGTTKRELEKCHSQGLCC
ncbi:hypothetical protein BDP27DRAFT_387407 [Rhodocollybia butyracea]|uniref:Uncharacterized protein n=1 Tax=Rhodocollybia butyracea TaxID=206335 RepID=A0A9P5Q0E2_9AGAR|nr:hypothetical protein BDP27DRAFT_387407 [Rhodocollybia butyracea]